MDVIVIGCGASGVAALRKLHDAGLKVLGLEAAERIGGRIRTVPFGDGLVDLGATWCHGEKDNVVFEIANPLGLLAKQDEGHKYFLLSNGTLVDENTANDILDTIADTVSKADKDNAKSVSECVRNTSLTNPVALKDPGLAKSLIEFYERNSHLGGQSDPKKGKSLKGLEENKVCEGDFWLNWKGRGYTTIIDVLLNKYPDPMKELPVQIFLNKEVESIRWKTNQPSGDPKNPLVQVKCKDGSLYVAKSVIVTASIGVLKATHSKLFYPPLPAEKVNTIDNLQMCVLDKIYFEFETPWWPKSPVNFTILWRDEDKAALSKNEQWVSEIFCLWSVAYKSNVLMSFIYGNGAEAMEKVGDKEFRSGIEKFLNLFRKQYQVSPLKSVIRAEWAKNPLTRGTYSYRSVLNEERGGGAVTLSEPLYLGDHFPIVCFAGEATSHLHHNSVHGAVEAGFREADRLIQAFKAT